MQDFAIAPTPHLIFGSQSILRLGPSIAKAGGRTAAVIVGRSLVGDDGFASGLIGHLRDSGIDALFFRWDREPSSPPAAYLGRVDALGELASSIACEDGSVAEPSPDVVDAIVASLPEAPDMWLRLAAAAPSTPVRRSALR